MVVVIVRCRVISLHLGLRQDYLLHFSDKIVLAIISFLKSIAIIWVQVECNLI